MDNSGDSEPLQLIEFIRGEKPGDTTIQLVPSTIDSILKQVGDRPMCVICVCGPSRKGKSFLLGYMIRCLEGLEDEVDDWMCYDEKNKPLKGFKFRNGDNPETQGIWVWSRPFLVKSSEGKEVAILLVDTQGTNDEFTSNKDMSAIVGLSLLFSSVMIFNFFTNLQEDVLVALNTYVQYGSLALENSDGDGKPFQKLTFLIRDWNNPDEFDFGSKGGKMFLEEKLKAKAGQPAEAKQVRETIKKCFQELDCFLMPFIGEKALYKNFQGSVAELHPRFSKKLEEFIGNTINAENIVVKEVMGNTVTPAELKRLLNCYIEIFNSDEIPTAENMWQATEKMSNANTMEKSLKKYVDEVRKKQKGRRYLQDNELESAHEGAKKEAENYFKKARKLGTKDIIEEFAQKLSTSIDVEFKDILEKNGEKRERCIFEARKEAMESFKEKLNTQLPFRDEDDTEFYDDKKITVAVDEVRNEMEEEFKESLADEEKLEELMAPLESFIKETVTALVNRNKAQKANAERKMTSIVEELDSIYTDKLVEHFDMNEYEVDDEKHVGEDKKIKLDILKAFESQKKPGTGEFQKQFKTKMEEDFAETFASLLDKHKLHIQQIYDKAAQLMREFLPRYELDLKATAKEDNEMDEIKLDSLHQTKSSEFLTDFLQNSPFPDGNRKGEELAQKLKLELDQIHSKVRVELVENEAQAEKSWRAALDHSLSYYKKTIQDKFANPKDFMTEEELESEHDQTFENALWEFENFAKVGQPKSAKDIQHELLDKVLEFLDMIKANNNQRLKLAENESKLAMTECLNEYNEMMKERMEKARSSQELDEYHNSAKVEAMAKLQEGVKDISFVNKYGEMLEKEIEECYEELKEYFDLKQGEEKTFLKMILLDAQKEYHDDMGKHFKNNKFMKPNDIVNFHQQVKASVMRKAESKGEMTEKQREDLEKSLDGYLDKYVKENYMMVNSMVEPAIGIDLGTTYCCVGVYYNGEVIIVPNQAQGGDKTTPSYVAFDPEGNETVGKPAKSSAYMNPENTIYDAKRLIGRKMDDKELLEDMKFWPFTVKDEGGVPKVVVNGNLLFPEQISAKLLTYFREMVEKHLKLDRNTIKKAVITVPAYFNDGQRQATKDAGELAGLEVLMILNEPTAAAIAYSLERLDRDPRKILIYDLGGGTFDIAVLDVTPKEIEVIGVNGDTHLGGEDFDKKLMEYCAESFEKKHGINLFDGKDSTVSQEKTIARRTLRRLQAKCEEVKVNLSESKSTKVELDAIVNGIDLSVDVSRQTFEELNKAYFQRSIDLVEKTLNDLKLRKEDIDDIVLVGGSSRIPKVQEMLKAFFKGKALNSSIHPDHAVGYGAAVQAALMNGEQTEGKFDFESIKDVTPMSLGIEVVTKELSVILKKNSKVPSKATEVYYTVSDNQTSINVKIFQGEDLRIAENNELLGVFDIHGIPPAPRGLEPVNISMEIDSNGILHVEAEVQSTRGKKGISVDSNKKRMTREEINALKVAED